MPIAELVDKLEELSPSEKLLVDALLDNNLLWMPHPSNIPQIQAYVSEADILYYGGAAGGGKSDLLEGLALTVHRKSIIFRREFKQTQELVDRSREILGDTKARYNQTLARWTGIPGKRILEFGSVQHEKDKENYKGRPHDLKGFDEIPDFTESQFRFLIAWNRTTIPGQRCRIVCAGNPPTHAEGEWVIRYWAPWISENHPNPALPGELRWFISQDGKDVEVESGDIIKIGTENVQPLSRTFIPAMLADNPYLQNTNYRAMLQGLPEPLRSHLLEGLFTIRSPDQPRQVIPTEWIRLANERWRKMEEPAIPITTLGVDPSRGGIDTTELARRKGTYYMRLQSFPGSGVPDGPACVALIVESLGEDSFDAAINIDAIGIGSSVYDLLVALDYNVAAVVNSQTTAGTEMTGRFGFRNVRSESYWLLREALDPETGQNLALPPDDELMADLVAASWKMTSRGIFVEPKSDIRKKLNRSPGKGDAVVLANYDPAQGVFFR